MDISTGISIFIKIISFMIYQKIYIYKKEILKGNVVPTGDDDAAVIVNLYFVTTGLYNSDLLPYLKNNQAYLCNYVSNLKEKCNQADMGIILSTISSGVSYAICFNVRIHSIEKELLKHDSNCSSKATYGKHFNITL